MFVCRNTIKHRVVTLCVSPGDRENRLCIFHSLVAITCRRTAVQIPLDGPDQTLSETRISDPAARFTKYLKTVLRLSYDNAKVTIDLRRTSNLQKKSYEESKVFLRYDSLAKL